MQCQGVKQNKKKKLDSDSHFQHYNEGYKTKGLEQSTLILCMVQRSQQLPGFLEILYSIIMKAFHSS